MNLDEEVENIIQEKNPQADAVNALIKVAVRKKGSSDTEIELKSDLSESDVKIHTVLDLMSGFLNMSEEDFKKSNVLAELVNKKERKALSKDRKSRMEIVEIARSPDVTMNQGLSGNEGIMRKFFRPHKPMGGG